MKWRPCDFAYVMGNHVNRYTQIIYRNTEPDLQSIQAFIREHQELTSGMGDLHNHIFSIINQNGYTYDDITGITRGSQKQNPVGSGDVERHNLR